jgi:hypothetical protein
MKKLAMALAATSMLAVPAMAQNMGNKGGFGGKVGQDPKVCLITYSSDVSDGKGDAAEFVTKAQYLPLRIAVSKDTMSSLIVTYGANGATRAEYPEIDIDRVQYDDTTVDGINVNSTTEEACEALEEYVENREMMNN